MSGSAISTFMVQLVTISAVRNASPLLSAPPKSSQLILGRRGNDGTDMSKSKFAASAPALI